MVNELAHLYVISEQVKRVGILSGVIQFGDICLFICVDAHMSFCTLTLVYFCVSSVNDPVPKFIKQILLIYQSLPVSP